VLLIPNDLSADMRNIDVGYTIKVNPTAERNSIHKVGVELKAGEKRFIREQSIEIGTV